MSNKGTKQTAITKARISLAKKKDRAELMIKLTGYISSLEETDFPSIVSASLHAGINEKALLSYESRTEENSDVRIILNDIRALQKKMLIEKGLVNKYNPSIATLLLKANHGIIDQPRTQTQNNIFNISPDLLSEALEISRDSKK